MTADGKGETFFGGGETHILALAFDGKGNLLAGTEPNGLILRIPLAAPPAAAAARPPNNKADKDNKTDQEKTKRGKWRRCKQSPSVRPLRNQQKRDHRDRPGRRRKPLRLGHRRKGAPRHHAKPATAAAAARQPMRDKT